MKGPELLEELFDEYHKVEQGSFKYVQVAKEDFGLSNEEILLLDDKKLNQIVSLKKYRAYREGFQSEKERKLDLYKTIQKKREVKKELDEQREMVKQV